MRFMQHHIIALAETPINPENITALKNVLESIISNPVQRTRRLFTTLSAEVYSKLVLRSVQEHTKVLQAKIAIALQRHFLATGQLPDSLGELVPKFLDAVPPDSITGGPMNYRRTSDSEYFLWSVGWNKTDEGGVASETKSDRHLNDWVWKGSVAKAAHPAVNAARSSSAADFSR